MIFVRHTVNLKNIALRDMLCHDPVDLWYAQDLAELHDFFIAMNSAEITLFHPLLELCIVISCGLCVC